MSTGPRQHVFPPPMERNYRVQDGRVQTRSLEAHIVDHCNLTCAECCSLSPLLPAWLADSDAFLKDLGKAAKVLAPRVFKLVGGEPLLHPALAEILQRVRHTGIAPEVFMARGITQEQVSAAADALVTAGERPTVEKIRAQLGTGSPNTVTRMLEIWRSQLATRLSAVLALPELPKNVGQAFTDVWRLAMTHAASLAQATLAHEQNALLAAQTSLAQERKLWEVAMADVQVQAQSAGQAREVAEIRLADVQRLVEQQARQLAELTQQRTVLQQRAEQLKEALDLHKGAAETERDALAQHLRAVEDRAHAEVDRAREESKKLQGTLHRLEREAVLMATRLEKSIETNRFTERIATEQGTRAKALEQQLTRMDGLPAALLAAQRALKLATQRETLLQNKLATRAKSAMSKTVSTSRKKKSLDEA